MSNEIAARCPACKEWWKIPKCNLGHPSLCNNCGQTVRLVPRSSRTIFWRKAFAIFLTALIVAGAIWLYQCRVNEAVKIQSGMELPDMGNYNKH